MTAEERPAPPRVIELSHSHDEATGRVTFSQRTASDERPEAAPRILKLRDSDKGESELHVVRVPEGFSFQIGLEPDDIGFLSVIVSPADVQRLVQFVRGGVDG